jgi:hypothetical protein
MNELLNEAKNLKKKLKILEEQASILWTCRGPENNDRLCEIETEISQVKTKLEQLIERLLEE